MYQEFHPGPELRPFVECGWLRSGSADRSIRVIPDGSMDVLVSAHGEVTIAGPADTHYDFSIGSHDVLAGLRLRAGVGPLIIGCPAIEFKNQQVALSGQEQLRVIDQFVRAETAETRMSALRKLIVDAFADSDPAIDRAVARAVTLLRARPDRSVSWLADEIGLSERQLRRRFDVAVGYGPKRLARIFRLQRLLDLIRRPSVNTNWAQLAAHAGYADQSHLINECLLLTGGLPTVLPVSVLSNTTPRSES